MKDVRRFLRKVVIREDGCWEWRGSRIRGGYGRFWFRGRARSAHRVSYELFVGELENRDDVLHKCDREWCVCPDHLFKGDHAANMKDMFAKGRCDRRGQRNSQAKLTNRKVRVIRRLYETGRHSYRSIAEIMDVSKGLVRDVVKRRAWMHVTNTSNNQRPV